MRVAGGKEKRPGKEVKERQERQDVLGVNKDKD